MIKFADYKNSRSVSAYEGDHGAETLTFIPASSSPDGKSYIIVANEVSGTLAVFEVLDNNIPDAVNSSANNPRTFNIFPNPSNQDIVYFNRVADIIVTDVMGRKKLAEKNALTLDISNYANGLYFIITGDGEKFTLVVSK